MSSLNQLGPAPFDDIPERVNGRKARSDLTPFEMQQIDTLRTQGIPPPEIARKLGLPTGTVRGRCSYKGIVPQLDEQGDVILPKPEPGAPVSQDEMDVIREEALEGATVLEISAITHRKVTTIRSALKRLGIKPFVERTGNGSLMTPDECATIRRMAAEGYCKHQIATKLKRNKSGISKYVRRHGIDIRTHISEKVVTPELLEWIVKLRADGDTYETISAETGVSASSIKRAYAAWYKKRGGGVMSLPDDEFTEQWSS